MTGTHLVPGRHFAALATGGGDADTVAMLAAAQRSKHALLLRAVLDNAPQGTAGAAYDLLAAAQRQAPGAVAEVLSYPHVGAWAAACLRELRCAGGRSAELVADLRRVAAAAALRAGLDVDLAVPVHDGQLVLPSLGAGPVAARSWRVRPDRLPEPWYELRTLTADSLVVRVDDVDPYRDWHGLGAMPRLPDAELSTWHAMLEQSWRILRRYHPHRVDGLAAGLRVLVPLRDPGRGRGVNATSRDAFGAVLLTPPADPTTLAVTLVHEFQHAKLNALLDLLDLYDTEDRRLFYAPWRDDPRPLGGLLHGVYAFLGVSDFWRVQRAVPGSGGAAADFEFARWRAQLRRVLDVLPATGSLTRLGESFVAGLVSTLDSWQAESVPAELQTLIEDSMADHSISWRLRNQRPAADWIASLAATWRSGSAPPTGPVPTTVVGSARRLEASPRLVLSHLRLRDADHLASIVDDPGALAAVAAPDVDRETLLADAAYAVGDFSAAADAYLKVLSVRPDAVECWAGLALAVPHTGPTSAAHALTRYPEVVYALHARLRQDTGVAPHPVELAGWVAGTLH